MSDNAISDEPPLIPRDFGYKPARKTADDGRIVVTLKYKIEKAQRNEYPPPNIDAVDVLRHMVFAYERGDVSLAHLVASACDIQVSAAK